MREIENYNADKYLGTQYIKMEEGIYKTVEDGEELYVTSLSFNQEPEYDEGDNAGYISQYPLEDILDKFYCYISDFYPELNIADSSTCYQEFASPDMEDIRKLKGEHCTWTNFGKNTLNLRKIMTENMI